MREAASGDARTIDRQTSRLTLRSDPGRAIWKRRLYRWMRSSGDGHVSQRALDQACDLAERLPERAE